MRFPKLALMILAVALASCTKKSEDTIKVGVYGPFTGGSAPMGVSMRNGVQVAIDEINAAGGVLGKKISMVDRDDEAKNERGGQIMLELLDKEKVVAVLGPINTGVADASTQYANTKKVPLIINVSAGAKVNELFKGSPENFVFRIAANDDIQSRVIVNEALKLGFKKPALLCDDTNYGQNGREKMEAVLKEKGVRPVYIGKFKIKDSDMSAQLQEARAAKADVLLVYGIGPELAAVSNSMARLGWKVDMIGSWTLSMSNYITNAGKNGNGTKMPQTFIEASAKSDKQKKFIADYNAKFKESPIASAVSAAQGYDSMYLLKLAIEQAQSLDGSKIRMALEDLAVPYEGITGSYTKPFSSSDHEAVKEANVMLGMVKDGIVVDSTTQKK
ncbi:amino acid ABC transporter substrate-binding protein [Bdellovibrio sp. ZAP7]|uniref:ABC transporter substrate-binding protein n=1 Tax=Bdellovibrio sp. ZAP7 TaxID=2231053 RepID=UPI0011595C41|nr:ABC transporter substrate-binding protein [Bdellovibrio sp. ZAP7]QDK46549.1 amino acid ABC transporter substrate-binding protein [Bdellovibrio sp. ZAP7]